MDELPKKHLFTKANYLLDLEHLQALERVAPQGDVAKYLHEVCGLYLKDVPQVIQEIERSARNSDRKAITKQNFQLKSLSVSVGATYIIDLCLQIDKSLLENPKDLSPTRALSEQLNDAFLVTRDQIQAYLAQLSKPHT